MIEGLVCLHKVLPVSDTFERSDDPFVPYPNAATVLESRQPDDSPSNADDGVGASKGLRKPSGALWRAGGLSILVGGVEIGEQVTELDD